MATITFNNKAGNNAEADTTTAASVAFQAGMKPEDVSRAAAKAFLTANKIPFRQGPGGLIVADGSIDLSDKALTKLPDLSQVSVTGDFDCSGNLLLSLKGAPCAVGGEFNCSNNEKLETLEHAPGLVGDNVYCTGTALTSLEHCPQNFLWIHSNLGTWDSWDRIPEKTRISPEGLARDATTLGGTMNIHKPLSLRTPTTA